MYIGKYILVLVLVVVVFSIGLVLTFEPILGTNPVDRNSVIYESGLIPLAILSFGTFLGLYSRRVIPFLISTNEDTRSKFNKENMKSVLLSALMAPIAMLALYKSISAISDIFLIGLMSYQNGFFFESVISLIQGSKSKSEL